MTLTRLEGALLDAAMPGICAAVAESEFAADLDTVEAELHAGHMQAWRVTEGAAGYIVTRTAFVKDTTVRGFWITHCTGRCLRPPLSTMRAGLADLIRIARDWHSDELRIEGRRARLWHRVFPDLELIERRDPEWVVLRKVL